MAHLAAYLCVISQHFRRGTCRAALAARRRGCLVCVRFAASTIFRILSSIEFAPWFVSSILRFSGIILRKVSADSWQFKLFVLLSLEAEIKFKSLTGRASALFLRAGRGLGWVCGSRPHSQALRNPDLRGEIGGTRVC